jgi:putative transposase
MAPQASPRRRHSIRLRGYDHTRPGAYFVTLCTQDHRPLFGRVARGEMELSPYGHIVEDEWAHTGELRPYVRLGALAVMPNHVHAIIWILRPDASPSETEENEPGMGTADSYTGTARRARTERFGKPVPGSLPTIVRAFKAAVTKRINERRGTPGAPVWHRSYYEHVIRDESDLARLRTYIAENPGRWAEDRFHC